MKLKAKTIIGFLFIITGFITTLTLFYFKAFIADYTFTVLSFTRSVLIITGILFLIPYKQIPSYIFDNHDYERNEDIPSLVQKLRLRAILLNNLSVVILFVVLLVIVTGFYLLIKPPIENLSTNPLYDGISIRFGATVLLIFLVQILFRVFKYLIRIAAFYNAKSDAIELYLMKPDLQLDMLMEQLTPDKYDITDINQTSISDNLVEFLKTRKP